MSDEAYWTEHGKIIKSPVETKNEDGSTNISLGFPVCDVSEYVDAEKLVEFFNRAEVCLDACAGIPTEQLEAGCVGKLLGVARGVIHACSSPMGTAYELPRLLSEAGAALAPFQKESGS